MKSMYDVNLNGKTVLLRIDLNTDIKRTPVMNERFIEHSKTIKELMKMKSRIVIISHQGRPGKKNFVSLKAHSKILSKLVGKKIKFVDDLYGDKAIKEIKSLENGDAILLENVRFYDDEFSKAPKKTKFVKSIQPLVDYFILDAFSVCHRSQTSVVGFRPAIAGRVLVNELRGLKKMNKAPHPYTAIIGGGKVEEPLDFIEHALKNGLVDLVLTGGVVSEVLMKSDGFDIPVDDNKISKRIMKKYGDKIVLPLDVVGLNGTTYDVFDLPSEKFYDIGAKTIKMYKEKIKKSRSIVISKPLGVYEKKKFERGTKSIFSYVARSKTKKFAGGGDTVAAMKKFRIPTRRFDYVSLGGGAFLEFLSGKKLPGLKILGYYG